MSLHIWQPPSRQHHHQLLELTTFTPLSASLNDMRNLFITHTGHLLQEFLVQDTLWALANDLTPQRTTALTEALASMGKFVRIDLTLWYLQTNLEPEDVLKRIRADVGKVPIPRPGIREDLGDVFVIEASDFSGRCSEEAIDKLGALCPVAKEQTPRPTPAKPRPQLPEAAPQVQLTKLSRREELAEELGVKPTDAMFWKMPGSYGSGKGQK